MKGTGRLAARRITRLDVFLAALAVVLLARLLAGGSTPPVDLRPADTRIEALGELPSEGADPEVRAAFARWLDTGERFGAFAWDGAAEFGWTESYNLARTAERRALKFCEPGCRLVARKGDGRDRPAGTWTLRPDNLDRFRDYAAATGFKAFYAAPSGATSWRSRSLPIVARRAAVADCEARRKQVAGATGRCVRLHRAADAGTLSPEADGR